jgi:ElaA protein|tara:strand:+ start:174 stop:605 length:432 start_codon:yes stop_codon:yes gene_type:complete
MIWEVKEWAELSANEVENIFSLRSEVFVVEQDCVYQDIDGKDQKANHVLGKKNNEIVAYARIFKPGEYFKEASFGRAVVKKTERGKGVGDELVINCLENITEEEIKISAQSYLKDFYGKHGFVAKGQEYLEDGIPHTAMFLIK